MLPTWRPTLRDVFALSLLGLLLGLGALYYLVKTGSETTILHSSERYRDLASREVAERVTAYLHQAPAAVDDFEAQIRHGLVDTRKVDLVEQGLLFLLLANPNISEATLTYADSRSFGPAGQGKPDPALTGQVAILLGSKPGEYVRKRTWFNGTGFVSQTDALTPGSLRMSFAPKLAVAAPDPTSHLTFETAVQTDPLNNLYGRLISTDLHWSQVDEALPESQRRVEVSVQKAIEDGQGRFAGVLRIGLMKTQIDGAVQLHITPANEADPHLIFLCDKDGRMITGLGRRDRVVVSGDDLRIASDDVPPVIAEALRQPILKTVREGQHGVATSFNFEGQVYLCTFSSLPQTQEWIVGIVVPREFYLGPLRQIQKRVLMAMLILIAVLVVAGALVLRSVARAQALIRRETTRMNQFEFSPAQNRSYLRDVADILSGLERAKTAMRAMSKYVPVNLVRRLYHEGQEPMLGGQPCELSVLFTDIKDFTSISERLPQDRLAEILGKYLEAMTTIIQGEKGTIDKYIGDAVMAFWNAPEITPGHEILACRAALRCRDELQKRHAAPDAGDMPRFETRLGLHRCTAAVGHFGAPDRFNYTAIGDGINLASRLEGLNKYYGTTIIASETIHAAAKEHFDFRLLDRVAVKGKSLGITIHELIGARMAGVPRPGHLDRYEQAFALYQRGDFAAALSLVENQADDAPSQLLARRCRDLAAHPPASWNGIHSFDSK